MEADKENVDSLTSKTRIPVPIRPLPPLPTHLIRKKVQDCSDNEDFRGPLRTINSGLLAGPSKIKESVPVKRRLSLLVNTKYVTQRKENSQLDWDYNVFKDDTICDGHKLNRDDSVISISDDDSLTEIDKKQYKFLEQKQKKCLRDEPTTVTPDPKQPLESNKVRNIKRSLKRPHSRELQGLSPIAAPRKDEEKFKRRLNFNESLQDKLRSPDYFKKSYTECLEREYGGDMFMYLLSIERRGLVPRIPSITRACVLNWLMRANGADGNPAVVQTASWYLDSVLSISSVQMEQLQLIAAACYWIAQKLHGSVFPASKLIKCSHNAFTSKQLMSAEKAILNKLKFPPQPVIPQDYITYLSWYSDKSCPGEIEVAATFLCMCGMMVDKSLCTELPSVIAAACVRNALLLLCKRHLIMPLQTCPVYRAAERKTIDMCSVCSKLHSAVQLVASRTYEYKAPLHHYGRGPNYIAQKIVSCASDLWNSKCSIK